MKIRIGLAISMALALLSTTACGMKVMTNGRVVDAVTNKPIEGAAVAIYWVHEKFALPGLGSNDEDIGTTETLTDAQGRFTIPRYLNRTPYMGVYKEGYVCWSSETGFNPYGRTYEEIFQKRNVNIQNDMVVQLQTMPNDISFEQLKKHGCFTSSVLTRLSTPGTGSFDKAVRHEEEFCFEKEN